MILRSSPASPFVRKVRIAAEIAGLGDAITLVVADTASETDSLRRENPLGKIPALILDDGRALYDSRVIVDFLDHRAGGGVLIPTDPDRRYACLALQALGDGIMDAALLTIYEGRFRAPEHHSASWLAHQDGKVARGLAVLEAAPPTGTIDVGHITVACALGYLDLRRGGVWRQDHPALVAWLDAFASAVPSFEKTVFKG